MAKKNAQAQRRADDGAKKEADPNEVVATLHLELTRGGNLNVSGNIADKVRAYGMLETGKDVIADWHVKQASAAKVPPAGA